MAETTGKAAAEGQAGAGKSPTESIKETIDSIIIAFCLAFVFRAFVVEAFIIPTGSMADTLLGEHQQVVCIDCGYRYEVGKGTMLPDQAGMLRPVYCPSCGQGVTHEQRTTEVARGGDKILVLKFPYLFEPPKRWNVIVFYNPARPEENFIKRLVGLPGEKLQIIDGDLYVAEPGSNTLRIARKPAKVQNAVWQPVYLNDYVPKRQASRPEGTVPRWMPEGPKSGWTSLGQEFTFTPAGEQGGRTVFRPPTTASLSGQQPDHRGRAQMHPIWFWDYSDYNGYQRNHSADSGGRAVTDLRLDFTVFFEKDAGLIRASVSKYDNRFIVSIQPDGRVELAIANDDPRDAEPVSASRKLEPFPLGQGAMVSLWNVDYRASVWVNGEEVVALSYQSPHERNLDQVASPLPPNTIPEVWLEAQGAPLRVRHVNLYRDLYYVAVDNDGNRMERGVPGASEQEVVDLRKFPEDKSIHDEFFVLGDNSAASYDSRGWRDAGWQLQGRLIQGYYRHGRVPRDHLIGRAFFVYWPSGLRIFGSNLQLVPNVGRMRLIR